MKVLLLPKEEKNLRGQLFRLLDRTHSLLIRLNDWLENKQHAPYVVI